MTFLRQPVLILSVAGLTAGLILAATPASAETRRILGVAPGGNAASNDAAAPSPSAQIIAATTTPHADGSVSGGLTLDAVTHRYTLSAPGPDGGHTLRTVGRADVSLHPHTTTDPGMNDMPSHTLMVPDGWEVQGGAWWAGGPFFSVLPSHDITLTSPDGVVLKLAPAVSFKHFTPAPDAGFEPHVSQPGQADGGYPVMPMPDGPKGWRRWILETGMPAAHPQATDVRVASVAGVPRLQPVMQRLLEPMQKHMKQMTELNRSIGMAGHSFADGAFYATRITFTEGGRRWEELSVVGVYWMSFGHDAGRHLFWGVLPGRTVTAPAGELEGHLPLLVAVADTLRPTPQWSRMLADHNAKLIRMQNDRNEAGSIPAERGGSVSSRSDAPPESRQESPRDPETPPAAPAPSDFTP